jgi:hypothetical protein
MKSRTNNAHIAQLREAFEIAYPDYAKRLNAAKSQNEFDKAYSSIKAEALENAKPYLSAAEIEAGCPAIALTPGQFASLTNATGDSIEVQLTALLKTAQIITPDYSDEQAAAQFILGGITAITGISFDAFGDDIKKGADMATSVISGIAEVGVPGIVAAVALSIVALIIPILYLMFKPASCLVALINETANTLKWVDDYNYHGKPVIRTDEIPAAVSFGENVYVACGIIQSDKRDGALVGTQYGFTYSGNHGDASFGVECPLTSIFVDNNCYCAIDSTAQAAAKKTDELNALSHSTSKADPNLNLSIKCNSPSGYVAYYVARVQDGSIQNI